MLTEEMRTLELRTAGRCVCAVQAFCRRRNLGGGRIHFRRAFQSFQRNPWGACAPRNRPHHNRSHDIKDIHSCSRFLSYFYAVVGPSSGAYAPPRLRRVRAFCRRQNLDAGRIYSARADKIAWGPAKWEILRAGRHAGVYLQRHAHRGRGKAVRLHPGIR